MVFFHDGIAECRLDAPDPEHEGGLDAKILFDAGKKPRVLLRFFFTGGNVPVGGGAVEILPELLVEFGLIADRFKSRGVRMYPAHDACVGFLRDAARRGLRAKRGDPLLTRASRARASRHDPAAN